MRRYLLLKKLGFIPKGQAIVETDNGDFAISACDQAAASDQLPWRGSIVLTRGYVMSLPESVIVRAPIDPAFDSLTPQQIFIIEDSLTNDEASTDAELAENLIVNGLTAKQAETALTYREAYRCGIFLKHDGPLFGGDGWPFPGQR